MDDFRFLEYHTEYSCKGSINKEMGKSACFSKVFEKVSNNSSIEYKIILYKGTNFSKRTNKSNACIFSKQEIRNHLRLLKSLYPIHYSVRDYKTKGIYKKFIITLKISNVPGTFHKYALTWLRYLYEFPYNVLLKDAHALKKDPIFRFESIANLFNLTISCYCDYPRSIHQIPDNCIVEKLKIADLRKKLSKTRCLNSLYSVKKNKDLTIPKVIGDYTIKDIEYWENNFEERKSIYLKIYKR